MFVSLIHSGKVKHRSSAPMPKWCLSAASWTWGRTSTSWESFPNTDSFLSHMSRWGVHRNHRSPLKFEWKLAACLFLYPDSAAEMLPVNSCFFKKIITLRICMTYSFKCTVHCGFQLQWHLFARSRNYMVSVQTNGTYYFPPLCTRANIFESAFEEWDLRQIITSKNVKAQRL